jgi:hypothetical protein
MVVNMEIIMAILSGILLLSFDIAAAFGGGILVFLYVLPSWSLASCCILWLIIHICLFLIIFFYWLPKTK